MRSTYEGPRDYQIKAMELSRSRFAEGKRRLLFQSPTGCHRKGQKVLRFISGDLIEPRLIEPVAVENVRIGDELVGPDGDSRDVRELHRGRDKMYEVTPVFGGEPFVVNEGHILTVTLVGLGCVLIDVPLYGFLHAWSASMRSRAMLVRVKSPYSGMAHGGGSNIQMTPFKIQELEGEEDYYGFRLSGDGRYLLNDNTITHNSGKTILAAEIIRGALAKGKRVLFLAHRHELIKQAVEKIRFIGIPANEIWDLRNKEKPPQGWNPHVFVGSVQMRAGWPTDVDILFFDEAHRSAAKSYGEAIERYPNAALLGLTGTATRTDGKSLDMYDEIVVAAYPSELVKLGHIIKPKIYTVPKEFLPDTSNVDMKDGDFDPDQLEEVCRRPKIIGHIVKNYIANGRGPDGQLMQAFCFAKSRAHSKEIADEFVAAGIKAVHVDDKTPKKIREAAIQGLNDGTIQVLVSADLMTEGVDVPCAKVAILARPTMSVTIFLQQVGRIVRPFGGLPAIVLDHAGNTRRHGHPLWDRDYDLDGKVKFKRDNQDECPGLKQCRKCLLYSEPEETTCAGCGREFASKKPRSDRPDIVDGVLVEYDEKDPNAPGGADDTHETITFTETIDPTKRTPDQLKREMRALWNQSWHDAWTHGHLVSWVHERMRKRFGEDADKHQFEKPVRPPVIASIQEMEEQLSLWCNIAARHSSFNVIDRFYMKYDVDLKPHAQGTSILKGFGKWKQEQPDPSERTAEFTARKAEAAAKKVGSATVDGIVTDEASSASPVEPKTTTIKITDEAPKIVDTKPESVIGSSDDIEVGEL